MKAVILAGGLGTRISEEAHLKPNPMVEIGGKPILWRIMKMYSAHGVNEFVYLSHRPYRFQGWLSGENMAAVTRRQIEECTRVPR